MSPQFRSIALGLTSKDQKKDKALGTKKHSYALFANGNTITDSKDLRFDTDEEYCTRFEVGDVIGCGFNF